MNRFVIDHYCWYNQWVIDWLKLILSFQIDMKIAVVWAHVCEKIVMHTCLVQDFNGDGLSQLWIC